jgi:hypothetical protein
VLKIAPNPTIGNTLVSLAQPFEREGLRLGLLDALGQKMDVSADMLSGQSQNIDLSPLPAGVYFIEVKTPEGAIIAREKLIKI